MLQLKIKKKYLLLILPYIIFFLFFLINDFEAFILYIMLVPLSLIFVIISFKLKSITLIIFTIFFSLAHGLFPAFFFLNKSSYTYSGWRAVKSFSFDIKEFLIIYSLVYFLMLIIILCSLVFSIIPKRNINSKLKISYFRYSNKNETSNNRINIYNYLLILFIVMITIPLNIFMYYNNIGIVGLPQKELPYNLTGLLYYIRRFVIPLIIFFLYYKSNRSVGLAFFVVLASIFAGILSASRSILILGILPVLYFALIENKMIRLLFLSSITFFAYDCITIARNLIYEVGGNSIVQLFNFVFSNFFTEFNFYETLSQLLGRLYGSQSIILAYQYTLENSLSNIINFFLGQKLIENQALELYGLILPEDKAFGVGIGLLAWIIILADKSFLNLVVLGIVLAVYINVLESFIKILYLNKNPIIRITSLPVSFILVFLFWSASDFTLINIIVIITPFLILINQRRIKSINKQIIY